ncbi:DUF4190 domain-containing protein [Cellulomonas marina]|uniref:DUF4190 domain-containing protein n=1 Tax=Cellulomonas marina TaxID=988821 RepID=A0A1I1AGK9_9CELL|nr:DUF4190 domain-containing protein [Cellulomonas marina]GIG30190.1 hypothetical protein Cma02nite_27900 [Cellulomonas marina]SFB37155.1 hypothetical protein SAMN05421867_11835 [Cellulomonas marina]
MSYDNSGSTPPPPPRGSGQEPWEVQPGAESRGAGETYGQPSAAPYGQSPASGGYNSTGGYGSSAGSSPAMGPAGGYGQPQPPRSNGMAIAALVLGILAILGCLIPLVNILSIVLGIVAVILGVVAVRRSKLVGGRGLGITGIVLGALAIVVSAVVLAATIAAFGSLDQEQLDQIVDQFESPPAEGAGLLDGGRVSL